jgi:hypothetical protein
MCDMRQQDKQEYRRLLDEIGEDYCPEGKYCIFKEFLIAAHPSRKLLVQLKCVDKVKFIWSKEAGKDIGWEQALKQWVDDGYATTFSQIYSDQKSSKEIFKAIIEEE